MSMRCRCESGWSRREGEGGPEEGLMLCGNGLWEKGRVVWSWCWGGVGGVWKVYGKKARLAGTGGGRGKQKCL